MLWYKSWLETRWRFLIGLPLLMCSAALVVFSYPQVVKLLPMTSTADLSTEIGRSVRAAAELERTYRGYVWSQWFRQTMAQTWTLFAVLLGTGGLLSQAPSGGALYTLSMPASRARLLGVRAATGLAELFVLAFVPSLLLPLLSPLVGQTYGVGDALIYSACLFIAGSVFFSLAFLMSTVFSDLWRPALCAVCAAAGLRFLAQSFNDALPASLFRVMAAESYFRAGGVPWIGLLVRALVSAAMLYGAAANISHRDF
jgi:ABC-2 type transport system permease protein